MGFGRKVGAFLGLVPEDQRRFAEGDDYADDSYRDRGFSEGRSFDDPDYRGSEYDGYSESYDRRDHADGEYEESRYERYPEPAYAGSRGGRGGRRFEAAETPVHGALAVKPEPAALPTPRREELTGSARPATVKLTGFSEARIIGEKYRDGQSVILDMTDMSDSDARRLVDFSAGLAFSLRGSIDKVAPKVFMLLPPDADIAAVASHYADSTAR
jgi:cell division inhibitor SepF